MRQSLIAANWKMHGNQEMVDAFIRSVSDSLSPFARESVTILLCPPSVYLDRAYRVIDEIGSSLVTGAQNMNENTAGAFTGELSAAMLSEVGAAYVLLGHSERRELFKESDTLVAEKMSACTLFNEGTAHLTPILCIGETLADRRADRTNAVLARQLDAVLGKVGVAGFKKSVIAYEPVWAIGTGETATEQQAQAAHAFIRGHIAGYNSELAQAVQILYGGSVKPENAKGLLSQPDIDGALVGGASLNADSFSAICNATGD